MTKTEKMKLDKNGTKTCGIGLTSCFLRIFKCRQEKDAHFGCPNSKSSGDEGRDNVSITETQPKSKGKRK